jgi:hypothetical protein
MISKTTLRAWKREREGNFSKIYAKLAPRIHKRYSRYASNIHGFINLLHKIGAYRSGCI